MDFLNQNAQVIIAAAAVLVLLVVVLSAWRAISPRMLGRRGQRLGVSEYHELDKTRRLVLLRRDNVEHLVLIGGPVDVVIETGITPAAIAAAYTPSAVAEAAAAPQSARPAPRPPVFGERKPPPLRPVEPTLPPQRGSGDQEP